MKKKKITALILSFLLLGQGLLVNAQENTSLQPIKESDIAILTMPTVTDEFDLVENEDYAYKFCSTASKGWLTIDFKERAENFTLVLKDEKGNKKLKSDFILAADGKGVKHLLVSFDITRHSWYTIKIINNDSTPISVNFSMTY